MLFSFKKVKIFSLFLVIIGLVFFLSGCGDEKITTYKIPLEAWIVFSDTSDLEEVGKVYEDLNPHMEKIRVKKFNINNYRKDLVDSLASGTGPDIFMIHNTWLPDFKDKIVPVSKSLINEKQFRDNFPDVAVFDFIDEGEVYAVPLSIDSLALYYNKDLFNAEGITDTPKNWEEFNDDVELLTKIDEFGNIYQSGAALGTASNINRSVDVLELLMFQNGAKMGDSKMKEVDFGVNALEFYTQFNKVTSRVYTWNPKLHNSIDAFSEGTLAMMFNYSWHYDTIKAKNSKLNFGVARVPQLSEDNPVNHVNYWGLAVAKNKSTEIRGPSLSSEKIDQIRILDAWQFLKFLTIKLDGKMEIIHGIDPETTKQVSLPIDPALEYLKKSNKPAARKDLIETQKADYLLEPFVYGNLIGKSWRHKKSEEVEKILADAIESVNKGLVSPKEAIKIAQERVKQLMSE